MKKVLVVVFVLAMGSAFAQTGSWYVGTSAMTPFQGDDAVFTTGFLMENSPGDVTKTTFGIAPEVGYFVTDKLSVGLGVGFNLISDKAGKDADALKTTAFGVNPYARYFLISAGNFSFYVQGGLSYVSSTAEYIAGVDADGKAKIEKADAINTLEIGFNPGIAYKLGDKFGLTASFGKLYYKDLGEDTNELGLKIDASSLKLGLHYSF
ncbi:MAG: porin family protein [Bacteroidales bacterium]|nr:porin family protein [Bacteroidales bacterium]